MIFYLFEVNLDILFYIEVIKLVEEIKKMDLNIFMVLVYRRKKIN